MGVQKGEKVGLVGSNGANTAINMTGGGQMVLVGVPMSSLTGAWIIVA